MSVLEDIKGLNRSHLFFTAVTVFSLFSPGLMILLLFKPQLVQSLDVVKILILSFTIGFPICFLNSLLAYVLLSKAGMHSSAGLQEEITLLFVPAMGSAVLVILVVYAAYMASLSFKAFSIMILVVEVIVVIASVGLLRHLCRQQLTALSQG